MNAVSLKFFVPQILVVLGWLLRCRFIEVAGPVSARVRRM
jgi:hypothetical protein